MSDNPHQKSHRFPIRISPRIIMATGIGVLIITLSLSFGWFGNTWDFIHHRAHQNSTTQLDEESQIAERNDSEIVTIVDSPPQRIGGLDALQNNIVYPEIAKKAGIEGRVFLQFAVDRDGRVSDIIVKRGIGGGCDEEAVRALSESKFVPGTHKGVTVRVKMSLPVSFLLN